MQNAKTSESLVVSPEREVPTSPPGFARDHESRDLLELARILLAEGRGRDASTICRYILDVEPANFAALFLSAQVLRSENAVEAALRQMIDAVSRASEANRLEFDLPDEIRRILLVAAARHEQAVKEGNLPEALRISELLVRLCPNVKLFLGSALSLSRLTDDRGRIEYYANRLDVMEQGEYLELVQRARRNHAAGEHEAELLNRLAIFDHPLDAKGHSAPRLENIYSALGCMLQSSLDVSRQALARRLIAATPPPFGIEAEPKKSDKLARFDQFYRLSIHSINIDEVYGPPDTSVIASGLSFADSSGKPLSVEEIQARIKSRNVEVAFFAAATRSYFQRCASSYVASVLNNCDVECLVFVCATGAWDNPGNVSTMLGIDSERVILCADDFVDEPGKYRAYPATDISPEDEYPLHVPCYYASVGLLNLSLFVSTLGIPVFLTGMDTVLQRGVRDLLEQFRGVDLVLNRLTHGVHASSKLINSLQLVYPTENALLFASFLKRNFAPRLFAIQQAVAIDQLFLMLALHHVLANASAPKVEYFGEFDINNVMFNRENLADHRDLFAQFRFINIFDSGQADKALSGSAIVAEFQNGEAQGQGTGSATVADR